MSNNLIIAKQLVKEYLSNNDENDKKLKLIYLYSNFTCNEGCRYCWIDENNTKKKFVLSKRFVKGFIDEAITLGVSKIKISGGEPFLNKEMPDIIDLLLDIGLSVEIETNGTLLSEPMVKKMAVKAEKIHFKVSLDSSNQNIQNEITGYKSAFEDTINGLNILRRNKIPFDVVTVASQLNIDNIEELIAFVKTMGAHHHRIILNLQPIGHGKENADINLKLSDIKRLMDLIYNKRLIDVDFGTLHSTLPPAFIPIDHLKLSFCSWGKGMCGIMPNGDVSICSPAFETMGIVAGNLHNKTITEIWRESGLFNELRQIQELEGVCGICVFRKACRGMCRIFASAKYGSLKSPYPFCQEMYEKRLFPECYLEHPENSEIVSNI